MQKMPRRFVFIGGLYVHKRLAYLLDAAELLAQRYPDFELHLIGDGPDRELVSSRARVLECLHWHGQLYGRERAELLASAQAILMPGLVGLVVIDAFHFRAPLITSRDGEHSPEIAYVEAEVNALVDSGEQGVEGYVETVTRFIEEDGLAERLRAGCEAASAEYSIDKMVDRFVAGVQSAFEQAGPSRSDQA